MIIIYILFLVCVLIAVAKGNGSDFAGKRVLLLIGISGAFLLGILILMKSDVFNSVHKPEDSIPSKWVSQNPDIWFEVLSYDKETGVPDMVGQINLDNKSIEITVKFWAGGYSMCIYNTDAKPLISGTCKFDNDRFTMTVEEDSEEILDGKYEKITFMRVDAK